MRLRWVGWLVVVVVLVGLGWLGWRSAGQRQQPVSVRFVSWQSDPSGYKQLVLYEVVNRSPRSIEARPRDFETRNERLGWWLPVIGFTEWLGPGRANVVTNRFGGGMLLPRATNCLQLTLYALDWSPEKPVRGELVCVVEESPLVRWLRSAVGRVPPFNRWLTGPRRLVVSLPEARPAPRAEAASRRPPAPARPGTPSEPEMIPAGFLRMQSVAVPDALYVYAELADVYLDVEPAVQRHLARFSLHVTQDVTRAEVVRLMEEQLQQQAGLELIKQPGTNRVRVRLRQSR